tara:strand:+ start:518 stop:934 length:417 start_codon:yes stop_codon:yes gene_type:complete
MCDYPDNKRYLKLIKTIGVCSFILLTGCNFFEAKQQVFECKKTHIDGQSLSQKGQVINYFHFNDNRLDISLGPVGVGLSGYRCEKNEFVYKCADLKKDNFDDQVILDRFTLAAQQIIRSSEKAAVIDYECLKLDRLVE